MKEFFYQKMDGIYFDQLIKSYRLSSKKIFICLTSKVDFFAVGQVSRKEQMINSHFSGNERTFKV